MSEPRVIESVPTMTFTYADGDGRTVTEVYEVRDIDENSLPLTCEDMWKLKDRYGTKENLVSRSIE